LIDRLHPASAPLWPQLEGTVSVDSLVLGPVTLQNVAASLQIVPTGAEITSIDAGLFGGKVHLAGTLAKAANDQNKPNYVLDGDFQAVNVADLGRMLGLRWTGAPMSGNGHLELSGYTGSELATSAKGALHFDCRQGSISKTKSNVAGDSAKNQPVPAALARFDRWSADAVIANGGVQLGSNTAIASNAKRSVDATITFADPPQLNFPAPKPSRTQKRK
jgi:uncharacterized protein involved in outer membrane biogenesis